MTSAALPETSFLDPAVLARIGNLELLARTVVEGFINGLHRSPHLGSSTDFAQHRAYMPGDDIRRIDWRLYGRTDRHFIKQFEADTNSNFMVLLDISKSMRYGAPAEGETGVTKLAYGCYLAAALTYFSSMQRDRVGLATFHDDLVDYVPPSGKHLRLVLHSLDRAFREANADGTPKAGSPASRQSTLLPPLRKLGESLRRRSMIVLISDFYEEPDAILDALTHIRGRGSDVIVFHVLDRRELQFPFMEASNFIDLETGVKMPVIPEYMRVQYRDIVRQHSATLAKRMADRRIDYALLDTSKPLDQALFTYLLSRQRFNRVR